MPFRADRHCRILIVGGGAIGTSLAYHLGRAGARDVLLVEKARLTHGSTWHAAGLVGQLRGKRNLTRLMQNSVAVFDRLEGRPESAIAWKQGGLVPPRLLARALERDPPLDDAGEELRLRVPPPVGGGGEALSPSCRPEGVEGAAFIPSDGYVDPYSLTMAYARARASKWRPDRGGRLRRGNRP